MQFDLVIRDATVVDGSGGPRVRADVGVAGDRIAAVGDLRGAQAERVISAAGRVVAPGFIDIHTHSDTTLLEYPEAESRVRQGVTTEVVGNCSFSPFPVTDDVRAFMGPCLAHGSSHLEWKWQDQEGYRHSLAERGTAVNVVPLVGHGSIRIAAMGRENRPPTHAELKTMQRIAGDAIAGGAFGLSTGLTLAPSSYAETEELIEISKAVAAQGGFYATHSRLWAGYHLKAVEEAIEIGRRAELPVQVSHQTIIDPRQFGQAAQIVGLMEQARREGVDVTFDIYPYIAGSSKLDQYLPDWALDGGVEQLLLRLADPPTRMRIRDETARGWFRGIPWQWDRIHIAHAASDDRMKDVGRSIAEIARDEKIEPIDCMLDLIESQRNDVSVVQFNRDEDDMQFFLAHRLAMIGSDGCSISPRGPSLETRPHPRYYGTYPRVLGRYCRELGTLTLEDAIHKMTSACADRLGLTDRGTIAPGKAADLVIFDPETIADRATFESPHQFPDGIDHVLVNGREVVSPAGHSGALPGRVLAKG